MDDVRIAQAVIGPDDVAQLGECHTHFRWFGRPHPWYQRGRAGAVRRCGEHDIVPGRKETPGKGVNNPLDTPVSGWWNGNPGRCNKSYPHAFLREDHMPRPQKWRVK
ncbi:hypothetical protein GCM10009712_24710 [Pseudarthrobacter sulfonivorans]